MLQKIKRMMIDIDGGLAPDPLEILQSAAVGFDPRGISSIYHLVREINDFGGHPDAEEWERLTHLVESEYKPQPVPLAMSIAAAKALAEYTHPKLSSINHKTEGDGPSVLTELTADEVEIFRDKFNAEY